MKSFETELEKHAQKIRLRAIERSALRERILSYMEYHPLPKHMEVASEEKKRSFTPQFIGEDSFIVLHLNSRIVQVLGGVFAVIIFVVVPTLAEYSVPGDALYMVKTGVNEGVRAQFANSPYEKVTFETKLIERRIAEARLLASEGKLTIEVEAQIAETVKDHAEAVQTGIAELREDNAESAAIAQIAFGSALEVQSVVLTTNEETSATSSTATILSVVNTVREEVSTDPENTVPSFDGLIAQFERETTRAYELFTTIKQSATKEEQFDIDRRLSDINRGVEAAKMLRTEDETGATSDLITALGLIQKLIAFMTDIDVRETVTLESLVPVVPTPEERFTEIRSALAEMTIEEQKILRVLESVVDADIREKVNLGLDMYHMLIASTTASREAEDLDTAEVHIKEARTLITDIVGILGITNEVLPQTISTITDQGVIENLFGEAGTTSLGAVINATTTIPQTTELSNTSETTNDEVSE